MNQFSEIDIALARDRFYPNWWLHIVNDGRVDVTDQPSYWVACDSEQEKELARASKPDFLKARFVSTRR